MNEKPKTRWLPRFGLKSMFALVLVVAVYFGSWPWVEERAHRDVDAAAASRYEVDEAICWDRIFGGDADANMLIVSIDSYAPDSAAPYIVVADEVEFDSGGVAGFHRRYYLWLFGWTVRLPITAAD